MSVDCDGYCDVWERRQQRARKDHTCSCCGETIPRGHVYATHFTLFMGETDFVRRCLRCEALYDALTERMRAAGSLGDEVPDIRLKCGHDFEERWGEAPPPELARLAFMTAAEMQAEALAKAVARG